MNPNGRPKATYLEDAQDLLNYGETPLLIAHRLGIKPESIARTAYRYGMKELAQTFYKAAKQ